MIRHRIRAAVVAVLALIVALVLQMGASHAANVVPGINQDAATTAVKIGGTGDPTSSGVPATPGDWTDIRIKYPAAIPILEALVGGPTYDASTQVAIARALAEIQKVPAGDNVVLMGNSQGADAVDRAANLAARPVTVYTVGSPNGPGGAARVLPNLPGVTFSQDMPGQNVYRVDYKITGDGIAALRNPLEGGNAPLGTLANGVGYVLYHLGLCDISYATFRQDRVIYTPNGEVRIMDATHPFVKLGQMAGMNITPEQEEAVEAFAPVGEVGVDSFAPTPQQVWNLGGAPTTAAAPATKVTQPVAATIPVETGRIEAAADYATQVAPQLVNEINAIEEAVAASPFAPQVNDLLAGLPIPVPVP